MDKPKTNDYYRIAASGSRNINHPAMRVLKGLAGKASNILDLGCGEGTRLNWLAEKGTGIDISETAITLAKKKFPRQRFLVGDLANLPFKKEKFDLIYSAYVFEHLERPEKVIGEAIKVLDKNGKLVIIAPNYGAPNRASPPFKGNRILKLFFGILKTLTKKNNLSWNKVKPISTKEKYDIDWDTTCEPYLKTLVDYLERQGLKIIYANSCWSEELPSAGVMQKTFRLLGERNVYPFKFWGPHLIVVAQKEGKVEKCVFCGARDYRRLFKIDYSTIEVCRACGLIRTNGLITENYESYQRDHDYRKYETHFENIFRKIYSDIDSVVKRKGTVLEVGCSTGLLLNLYKKAGWKTWGVEPSGAAEVTGGRGIKVLKTTIDKAKLPEGFFDLVILNHTLEHLEDPVKALAKVYKVLKEGGTIFIGVPNAGGISANIWGRRWPLVLPLEHRYHFYPAMLEKILNSLGFQIVFTKSRSGIFNLDNPRKGLAMELKDRPKSFLLDFISIPFTFIESTLNRGSNLSIIGQK